MKYHTCRYEVAPREKDPTKRLCLKPTVNGQHCEPHVGAAAMDASHEAALFEKFMREPIWPKKREPELAESIPSRPIWPQ